MLSEPYGVGKRVAWALNRQFHRGMWGGLFTYIGITPRGSDSLGKNCVCLMKGSGGNVNVGALLVGSFNGRFRGSSCEFRGGRFTTGEGHLSDGLLRPLGLVGLLAGVGFREVGLFSFVSYTGSLYSVIVLGMGL